MSKSTVNKSAITGKFVSAKTVKSQPKTTYVQSVNKPSGGKGKKG